METKYPGVYCDKTKTKFWTSFYYVNSKGKRKTKIPNIVKDVLNEYLQEQLKNYSFSLSNRLFPGEKNNPLSRTFLNKI